MFIYFYSTYLQLLSEPYDKTRHSMCMERRL